MRSLAITGSTGKVGGRVATLLAERQVEQLLVGRDPARLPDLPGAERRGPAAYDDTAAMTSALSGADTLFLVSAGLSGRRPEEHASAFAAALAAGASRIVYLSLVSAAPGASYVNARDHGTTEQHLATLDVPWTVVRAGFYASMLPGLVGEDGEIRAPAGDGRVAAVTQDDIADVVVRVLLDETGQHDGRSLDVTGPEALDLAAVAERLSRWSGRAHRYVPETEEDALPWRRRLPGATEGEVQAWLSWYRAIATGEVAHVTDVVARVTGHSARPVEDAWGTGEPQPRLR